MNSFQTSSSPADYTFALSGFGYLAQEPVLPVTFGATGNRELAEQLQTVESLADVYDIEARYGQV